MPLPVITNTHRNSVEGLLSNGAHWANIIHTRWTGGGVPTTAQRQAMVDTVASAWRTDLGGANTRILYRMKTTTSLTQIRSTPLDGVTATLVSPYNNAGVEATDALPPGTAFVLTLRTALRGRSYRGRVYLGGFCENIHDPGGICNAGSAAIFIAQMEAVRVALIAITWELVVASYKHSTAQVVTTVTGDTLWDSQRRRGKV